MFNQTNSLIIAGDGRFGLQVDSTNEVVGVVDMTEKKLYRVTAGEVYEYCNYIKVADMELNGKAVCDNLIKGIREELSTKEIEQLKKDTLVEYHLTKKKKTHIKAKGELACYYKTLLSQSEKQIFNVEGTRGSDNRLLLHIEHKNPLTVNVAKYADDVVIHPVDNASVQVNYDNVVGRIFEVYDTFRCTCDIEKSRVEECNLAGDILDLRIKNTKFIYFEFEGKEKGRIGIENMEMGYESLIKGNDIRAHIYKSKLEYCLRLNMQGKITFEDTRISSLKLEGEQSKTVELINTKIETLYINIEDITTLDKIKFSLLGGNRVEMLRINVGTECEGVGDNKALNELLSDFKGIAKEMTLNVLTDDEDSVLELENKYRGLQVFMGLYV